MKTDFLVIGSGIAGLSFALQVAKHGTVTIITKKNQAESNTNYAQGGIAAALSSLEDPDSFEKHIQDTLDAGYGLCHEDVVRRVVSKGPTAIQRLLDWGVRFSKNGQNEFDLTREGGHSERRVLHFKDTTGAEIERALLDAIRKEPNIRILEHFFAIDLITSRKHLNDSENPSRCLGVYALNQKKGVVETKVIPEFHSFLSLYLFNIFDIIGTNSLNVSSFLEYDILPTGI